MSSKDHWDAVYRTKPADGVSWFQPHLERSLAFLEAAKVGLGAGVIDVGGGASTFVDDLLERGYTNVTVLDLSQAALDATQARLGERAARVRWLCADVTDARLPEAAYDFWRNRTLTTTDYVDALEAIRAWSRRVATWWTDDGFDLLLTPTMAALPPPIGTVQGEDADGAFTVFARPGTFTPSGR